MATVKVYTELEEDDVMFLCQIFSSMSKRDNMNNRHQQPPENKKVKSSDTPSTSVPAKDNPQRKSTTKPKQAKPGVKRPCEKPPLPPEMVDDKVQGERVVPVKRRYSSHSSLETSSKCQAKHLRNDNGAEDENTQKQDVNDNNIEKKQVLNHLSGGTREIVIGDVASSKTQSKSAQTDSSAFVKQNVRPIEPGSCTVKYRGETTSEVVSGSPPQSQVAPMKDVITQDYEKDRNMRVREGIAYFTNIWQQANDRGKEEKQSESNIPKKMIDSFGGGERVTFHKRVQSSHVTGKCHARGMASGDAPVSPCARLVQSDGGLVTQNLSSNKQPAPDATRPSQSVRREGDNDDRPSQSVRSLVQFYGRGKPMSSPGHVSHLTDTDTPRAWSRSQAAGDQRPGGRGEAPGVRLVSCCSLYLQNPSSQKQSPSSSSSVKKLVEFFDHKSPQTEGSKVRSVKRSLTCPRCRCVIEDREMLRGSGGGDGDGTVAQLEWDYEWDYSWSRLTSPCRMNSTLTESGLDYSLLDILTNTTPRETSEHH